MGRLTGARRTARSQRGQMLAISAIFATALLGLIGLAVDAGLFFAERRQAQNAADHAALAAAYEIAYGGGTALATTAALENAAASGFDDDGSTNNVAVNIPPASGEHAGDGNYVEVVIDEDPPTFFIHVLTPGGGVSARGVASTGEVYALFAKSPDCGNADTLQFSGSTSAVEGRIHANANVKIPGSSNDFDGPVTRVCDLDVGGSGNTFDPAAPPPVGARPFPLHYDYDDFPCTMEFTSDTDLSSVPQAWVNNDVNTKQLKPGVYCSTRKLTLSGSDVTGNVTLVAQGDLTVSGSNFTLTAYWNNILLFTESSSSSALDASGSGGSWTGIMLAEYGNAKVQGSSNLTISGSVMANTISVSGSDFNLTAMNSSSFVHLVE